MQEMKKALIFIAAAAAALLAESEEVSAAEAAEAARAWIASRPSARPRAVKRAASSAPGKKAAETATYEGLDGKGRFHVVSLDGGGFVAMASDTDDSPVLAFSESSQFKADEANPLMELLRRDAAGREAMRERRRRAKPAKTDAHRMSWRRLRGGANTARARARAGAAATAASQTASRFLIDDPRIDPLVQSRWDQSNVKNKPCYNYYTPFNYLCGCVATAGAQIMRYHRFPVDPVEQKSFIIGIDAYLYERSTRGGTYAWDDMPLDPANETSLSDAQRQAIGHLTYDLGVACTMYYGSSLSDAPTYMLRNAYLDYFGYSSAECATFGVENGLSYTTERLMDAVVPSLDARLPVALHIGPWIGSTEKPAHAVVADGYGYAGVSDENVFFLHINVGWSGTYDAWYAPPNFVLNSANEFQLVTIVVYNIKPEDGDGKSIASGRVLDAGGAPVAGAAVSVRKTADSAAAIVATTDSRGIYAIFLEPGKYEATVSASGLRPESFDMTVGECVSMEGDEAGEPVYPSNPIAIGNVRLGDTVLHRKGTVLFLR